MPNTFSASALIDAPSEKLYAIIADYRSAHPAILPNPPFTGLEVTKGGLGAGTEFVAYMKVMGQTQSFRGVVSEPEPGRVLVKANDNGYITRFMFEPQPGGQTRVTFLTEMPDKKGIGGALERWLMPRMMRPVYVRELENLAAAAKKM